MLWLVAPVDHKYETPMLDVRVTLPPSQKVVEPSAPMTGCAGSLLTVTVTGSDGTLEHPYEFIIRTVCTPLDDASMLLVSAPLDHIYPVPRVDVSVTLPPSQKVSGPPAVITGLEGSGLTVITVITDG